MRPKSKEKEAKGSVEGFYATEAGGENGKR